MHGMESRGCRKHWRTSENAWDEILCNISGSVPDERDDVSLVLYLPRTCLHDLAPVHSQCRFAMGDDGKCQKCYGVGCLSGMVSGGVQ